MGFNISEVVDEVRGIVSESSEQAIARIRIAWKTGLKPWEIDADKAIRLLGDFEAYNNYKTKDVLMPVHSLEGVLELIVSSTVGIYHTSGINFYHPDRAMREILPKELLGIWTSTLDELKFFQSEVTRNYLKKPNQPSAQQ